MSLNDYDDDMKDVATETLEDELAVLWGNMSAAMARFCALLVAKVPVRFLERIE